MKNFRKIAIMLALAFVPATAAYAQKGKPSPTPTPTPHVITAKFNYCAAADKFCESANREGRSVPTKQVSKKLKPSRIRGEKNEKLEAALTIHHN
jgi:hypothetical protein